MKQNLYLLLLLFALTGQLSAQTTIPVQITQDTLKACQVNYMTADFIVTSGSQHIKLKGELIFGSNSHESCGSSQGILMEILSLKDNHGNAVSYTLLGTDTVNSEVEFRVNTSDTCTLAYRVHIDCSAIPSGSAVFPVYFKQIWKDSIPTNLYDLNTSGTNYLLSLPLKYPRIIDRTNLIDSIGYRERDTLEFMFQNTGSADAHITTRFNVDATDYCGALIGGALSYRINSNGSSVSYTNGDPVALILPQNDTLIFRQAVVADECLLNSCTPSVIFSWHCSEQDSLGTAFCETCLGSDTIHYNIRNRQMPELVISRIFPVTDLSANYDVSCPNSLADMRTWAFDITTVGKGALDSAVICFQNYGADMISSLGLIPNNTIHIDTNCFNCSFQMILGQQLPHFCSDSVPNAIDSVKMIITDFGQGDTIRFEFKTFRCVQEDTLLYNTPKHFTNWTFENTYSRSKCGQRNISPDIVPQYIRSSIITTVNDDVDLKLIYTPTVTDLSVAHGVLWGDSADFDVKMNGLFLYGVEKQLLGCNYIVPNCTPNGYFRITVECDSGLRVPTAWKHTRIRYFDSTGTPQNYYPEYYYIDNVPDACLPGSYVYYFNLNDPDMMQMLNTGKFLFRLQACCGGQNGGRKYKVKYDWLLNPDGSCNALTFPSNHTDPAICAGTNCAWLPLSFVEDDIVIHCPGCVTPGIVIRSYRMERSTYGYMDNNDDGFADNSFTPIVYNSPSYLATKSDYGWINSGFGDELTDYQVAEFAPGDAGAQGYTYPQMQSQGVYLNYIQLNRTIRAGLDTMNVQPDTVTLYIDYPFTGGDPDSCIDCHLFNVLPTAFHTQRILKFFGPSLNKILALDTVNNQYFFTFSSFDNGVHQGVLHGSDTIYNSLQHPYLGFFERQQYRLSVHYNVSGNFKLPQGWSGTFPLDAVRIQADIYNKMWLCGDSLPIYAWSFFSKNPADSAELDSAGWYIPPDTTIGDNIINQIFADTFMFNCENLDAVHYFYSHGYDNITDVSYVDDCLYRITTSAITNLAGNLIDPYPNEYHPSAIQPHSYTFTIPPGYQAIAGVVGNEIYSGPVHFRNTDSLITIPSGTSFTILDSVLNKFECLQEGDSVLNKRLYFGDTQTARYVSIFIESDSCDTTGFIPTPSLAVVSFEGDVAHCTQVNNIARAFVDTLFAIPDTHRVRLHPNDSISFTPLVNAYTNRICFALSISNPLDTFPDNTLSTLAPNYFIVVPDTGSVNWLHNWTYYSSSTGTIMHMSNQFFLVDTTLMVNEIHNGDSICASFVACPDTATTITFVAGWGCSDTLTQPFDTSVFCGHQSFTYTINLQGSGIELTGGGSGNRPLSVINYTLCDTLFYECCFKSNQPGNVTPDYIELPGLPAYMGIAEVSIRQGFCDSASTDPWHPITIDTLTRTWPVTVADMVAIGYTDSVLSTTEGISVRIGYFPDCHFIADSLPDVILHANSYCMDPISRNYPFSNTLNWDGNSECHDCFTLDKVPELEVVSAGDTTSFNIIICANNADSGFVLIHEYLPANFSPIGSNPWYAVTPAQGCDTVVVSGYFNIPGSCEENFNTVHIVYAGYDSLNVYNGADSLIDSACVNVGSACIDSTTIVFLNNDSSSNYFSVYTNQNIYLEGLFVIDRDLKLIHCNVYTAPGSSMQILGGNELFLDDSTTIVGCDSMWQGIKMEEESRFYMYNGSVINDAAIGLKVADYCEVEIDHGEITECVKSVLLPPHPSSSVYYLPVFTITGSKFGLFNGFKPDYIGQSGHGSTPEVAIELNDVVTTIGNIGRDSNWVHKCNVGFLGRKSEIIIQNSYFDQIMKDAYYSNHYDGTAMVLIGDKQARTPASLEVDPMASASLNVLGSYRGIYTELAALDVNTCKFERLTRGIEVTRCTNPMQSLIVGNEIQASEYGMYLHYNTGSANMMVTQNSVLMSGNSQAIGIFIDEPSAATTGNYHVVYNPSIRIIDGQAGISVRNALYPEISCNIIRQESGGTTPTFSGGIVLSACDKSKVHSNNIQTNYSNLTNNIMGMKVDNSANTTLSCNYLNQQKYGIYFGSSCGGTDLKGNTMYNNFEGLHLNTNAVIGPQVQKGNEFIGNFDTTSVLNYNGANNENNIGFGLQLSEIDVHVKMGVQTSVSNFYFPKLPLNNFSTLTYVNGPYYSNGTSSSSTDWFVRLTGNPYSCPDVLCPNEIEQDMVDTNNTGFERMIAQDSTETVDFVRENKSMSREYLFEKLMENDSLVQSDSVFVGFKNEVSNSGIGELYSVKQLSINALIDSAYSEILEQIDSTLSLSRDSIAIIDSLIISDTTAQLLQQKENLISDYNYWRDLYQTIDNTQLNVSRSEFAVARTQNATILVQEIPEQNQKQVNDALFALEAYGVDSILNYSVPMLAIAVQCPYSGGKAVYQARWYVKEFINDTLQYDDAGTCLTQGLRRIGSPANQKRNEENLHFIIVPNPNQGIFEIKISGNIDEVISIEILNSYSQLVYPIQIESGKNIYSVNQGKLPSGVYLIQLKTRKGKSITRKLVRID